MSSPSTNYAESVLLHLEKVQELPGKVQDDIANRVDNCIKMARAAKSEAVVSRLAICAVEEQAKAIGRGAYTMDPRWAAPAIAEAWCYATISLSKGYLEQLHAEAIIGAIEAFTSRSGSRHPSPAADQPGRPAAASSSRSALLTSRTEINGGRCTSATPPEHFSLLT